MKKEERGKKELSSHPTGYNYQMYSSAFPGWVKIQLSYRYPGIVLQTEKVKNWTIILERHRSE